MSRRIRWTLLALISTAFIINFIHRQTLATLAPVLRDELSLSSIDYSFMVVAFLLGMGLFQLPVGLLMDRKGPRFGFSLIVFAWSIASGLHGLARTVVQFCGLRFLLGAGQCGNYSGGLKVIGETFPSEERALAGGILSASMFVGSMIGPPLVVFLTLHFSWHTAFFLPSTLGILWVAAWLRVFPRGMLGGFTHAPASSGTALLVFQVGFRELLHRRQTWAVIAMRALGGGLFQFYTFWLPDYLQRAQGIDLALIGMVVWIPFLFAGVGSLYGGYLSGVLLRRGYSLTFSRRLPYVFGCGVAAASNLLVIVMPSLPLALAALSLANLGSNIGEPIFVGFVTDVFPEHTIGRVTALTGLADNVTSIVLMLTTGIVLDHFSYLPVFMGAALLPVLQMASAIWLLGPVKKLVLNPARAGDAVPVKAR